MSLYKIQGRAEKLKGIYYEFNSDDEPLGEGGMGKVFKGRCVDEATGKARNVAVKFMYSDLPPYAIEKARREAAIQFRHGNLIEMLGFIETEERSVLGEPIRHYHVVSELLEGVSLDKMFEGKLTDQQGHFVPFAEKLFKDYQQDVNHFAVEIIKNILSGLMTMHDAGYIHRDIDPTNIMITTDGHIKLIDFGIAKKMNSLTTHDKHLTQAGQFVGKPEYAAPELVLGAINEQNQTTDIYAVGILLFQCIVGHPPFEGDRSDILQKQLHAPLPLKLIKHKGLRAIIAQATEKSRAKRFQSAAEFRVAIERINLNDEGGFEWKPLYNYVIGGIVACSIAGVLFLKPSEPDPPHPIIKTDNTSIPYELREADYKSAVASLHDSSTSSQGMDDLKKLSDEGNAKATYLLSRLYYNYKTTDYCPDSISNFQQILHVSFDDNKAHDFLKKSVEQDGKDYHSLFELACDFWKVDQRIKDLGGRDPKEGDMAIRYFHDALVYAKRAHDGLYVKMILSYKKEIDEWLDNVEPMENYHPYIKGWRKLVKELE